MNSFTHFDSDGKSRIVDISSKDTTYRMAVASAEIHMSVDTLKMILDKSIVKGDVFEVARLAGIMAAKKTSQLIPLCHQINLTSVNIDFDYNLESGIVNIKADTKVSDKTGVEMEALTAVSVAALTVYDMCKSVDKRMIINNINLLEKTGGKSGHFKR